MTQRINVVYIADAFLLFQLGHDCFAQTNAPILAALAKRVASTSEQAVDGVRHYIAAAIGHIRAATRHANARGHLFG